MMTGLPGDTPDISIYTASRFIDIKPDGVRIYPTVVVYGTQLYDMWKSGVYKEHTIEDAVELCGKLYQMFAQAGVPVIRMGLNPSDILSNGGAVAGAYHPAFGELVYSRVYYKKAVSLLQDTEPDSDVTIAVAKGRVSRMTGINRRNIDSLKREFSLRSLKITESGLISGDELLLL